MKHPLAVVTMVYNEAEKIPYWLAHYHKQLGLEHCYVVDHGTTDGSTQNLFGASRISIPRSPQDNERRLGLITDFTRGLLTYYARVAYVDADELLVADPHRAVDLREYSQQCTTAIVTSIGLEVCHDTENEAPLDATKALSDQRRYVMYSSSMCKANLVSHAVRWSPGWHSYDGEIIFDDLYLFHLRHADLNQALDRLSTTRTMPWALAGAGAHQKTSDEEMARLVTHFGGRPKSSAQDFQSNDSPLPADLNAFIQDSTQEAENTPFSVPLARYGSSLISLPERFKTALSIRPLTAQRR